MTSKLGTVRVSGLPQDIGESRLIDKLKFHFLRKRNGGGEILSVTVSKTVPRCSFIMFEDSKVARRVVEHQNHTLSVSGKDYELNVSLHSKEIDPDEIFVDTAVTVDYSKLPGGKASISNLLKNNCDVKCTFHVQDELCTFKGRYTDVQTFTMSLLRLLETQNSNDVHSLKSEATQDDGIYKSTQGQTERKQGSETLGNTSRLDVAKSSCRAEMYEAHQASYTKDGKGMEALYKSFTDDQDGARASPHSYSNYTQIAGELEGNPTEDFSVVVDSDIFQYLQKNCLAEYQTILNRHGVEVIDVTSKDITTLYLHLKTGANRRGVEGLRLAYGELGWLFQDKEAQLRKEQLAKDNISRLGLQQAIKTLSQRFTNLLINQDQSNVYLVGSGRDVSEAKQFLMELQEVKQFHGHDSSHPSKYASLPFVSESKYKKGRAVGSRELKMAPTFRKSMCSGTPKDDDIQFSVNRFKAVEDHQTNLFSSRKHITMDDEKLGSGAISSPSALHASKEKDYLFKRYEPASTDSMSRENAPNVTQKNETRPTKAAKDNESQSYSLDHMDLSGQKMVATGSVNQFKSISNLRRSKSFSGVLKTKLIGKDCNSDIPVDLFGKTKEDEKFDSHQESMDVLSVDVVVPKDQWLYANDVFHIMIEDITSDLQMKVTQTSEEVVLHLRGKYPAKVHTCQKVLTELFTNVAKDFTTQEMLLTHLGLSESKNVTVEVLCTAIRGKCEKVKIVPMLKNESLLILGPKLDCMEAISLLKQMFSSGTEKELTIEEGSMDLKPFAVTSSSPGIYSSTINQNTARSETQYQETSTSLSSSRRSEVTKAPVLKPQLGRVGPVDKKSLKKVNAPSQAEGSLRITNGEVDSAAPLSEHSAERIKGLKPEEIQITSSMGLQTQNNLLEGDTHLSCICGTATSSVSLMACGVAMCPLCQKQVHSICNECTKSQTMRLQWATPKHYGASQCDVTEDAKPTELKASPDIVVDATGESMSMSAHGEAYSNSQVCPKPEVNIVGIQGTMSYSEMSISLSGHNKNTTLKITYNIPDGIQAEQHPNPGRPFQGGTFHAFLPLNESTRKLLPSLKQAFDQGQIFTVRVVDSLDRVTWGNIPHKTSIEGGISRNGYPDSKYLKSLAEALRSTGMEEG